MPPRQRCPGCSPREREWARGFSFNPAQPAQAAGLSPSSPCPAPFALSLKVRDMGTAFLRMPGHGSLPARSLPARTCGSSTALARCAALARSQLCWPLPRATGLQRGPRRQLGAGDGALVPPERWGGRRALGTEQRSQTCAGTGVAVGRGRGCSSHSSKPLAWAGGAGPPPERLPAAFLPSPLPSVGAAGLGFCPLLCSEGFKVCGSGGRRETQPRAGGSTGASSSPSPGRRWGGSAGLGGSVSRGKDSPPGSLWKAALRGKPVPKEQNGARCQRKECVF